MPDVIIVGAGLAGLACARRLVEIGKSFVILEACDVVGGRVRTDLVDGFRLDRGFQILLTAYPEAQRMLDYSALNLKKFNRGALIRFGGQFHRFSDPRREPIAGLGTVFGSIGSIADKLRVLSMESKVRAGTLEKLFEQPEGLTLDYLRWNGKFSDSMIDRFFRPFFGGIFLERELVTSARMFRFLFRMFAEGDAAVPALGMGEIPKQLSQRLPAGSIRLNTAVEAVSPKQVVLKSGERLDAGAVVVATEGPEAQRLLNGSLPSVKSRSVCCFYYSTPQPPLKEPTLVLNADEPGPINNLAVMSSVSPDYSPSGQSLISVSVLGEPSESDADLDRKVRDQLKSWYGIGVTAWKLLKTYRIRHALPDQTSPALELAERPVKLETGLFVCGDHRDNASIHGAMKSGFRAAQELAVEP